MTDSRLRELERRYRASGAKTDELAYDAERVRMGQAIETGFLQRCARSEQVYYGNGARLHLGKGVVRNFAWYPIVGQGYRVLDVEYADERLHLLATLQSVAKHFSIGADGKVKLEVLVSERAKRNWYGFVKVEGEVGYAGYVDGFMRQTLVSFKGWQRESGGTLFGFERDYGFLSLHRLRESEITGEPRLGVFCDNGQDYGVSDVPPVKGVVVQDGVVYYASEVAASAGAFVQSGELLLLPQSRFVTGRYVAPDADSLEKYYPICGFSHVYRVLQEFPRKNLEGLLIAVDRALHKRKKK